MYAIESPTLAAGAVEVLATADPAAKAQLAHGLARRWRCGEIEPGTAQPPDRPARPVRPLLLPPREMPKRKAGPGLARRIALLHALAHIELNAIDLAWDLIARFASPDLPRGLPNSPPPMATCRPMTGSGRRPCRLVTTSSPALPSPLWYWRPAAST